MRRTLVFTSVIKWLNSTELFARPSKQLPGKWILFEYYTEPGEQLVNLKEEQLIKAGYYWEIDFEEYGQLNQGMNLPLPFSTDTPDGTWQTARNFLTLSLTESPEISETFQYAISGGNLKLLQKDSEGRIIFFGFFRRIEEAKH